LLWDLPYIVEILTPKRRNTYPASEDMSRFNLRYEKIMESGCALSIPDNPMGRLRHPALETLGRLSSPPDPERTLINLNTYHSREELDRLLRDAAEMKIRYLLIVRGDGGPDLPKLQPRDIGAEVSMVTSIELLHYINSEYGDQFCTGAAFNQYKPESVEMKKLRRKFQAGAQFIVTQPVMGEDARVNRLLEFDVPLIVEAWMSPKVELFLRSVKGTVGDLDGFEPRKNLDMIHRAYPQCAVYLSMLGFNEDWSSLLSKM
jgi:methylenetetrahydrofolate reductase (NADPH)